MKRVLALTRYDRRAASTRQRFLQYGPALAAAGFELQIAPLFGEDYLHAIDAGRRVAPLSLAKSYFNRLGNLFGGVRADLLWVQYELFPYLPALFERAAFLRGVPVVVDYDDAFFHKYDLHRLKLVRTLLGEKMRRLIGGADGIVAGNSYLADYARKWNKQVTIVPTVVDTNVYHFDPPAGRQPATIGWIGSPTTWSAYVRPHLEMLRQVVDSTRARFLVVGAGDAAVVDAFPGMELRTWSEASEVADIQEMDIGIMPLPNDPWAKGKCGYKLIQYMACGLPTVASSIGVNSEIVVPGETGFLAQGQGEWRSALVKLVNDPQLRRHMGGIGRERAVAHYSLSAQAPTLVDVMRQAIGRSR